MFHDAALSEPDMSKDTGKPVPPLTHRTEGGKRYTRFADIEAEITEVWPRPPSYWIAAKKKLKSETIVFLIKKGEVKDDHIRGELQAELNVRTVRIANGGMKGFDYVLKEEMALEVEAQVFNPVWLDANGA